VTTAQLNLLVPIIVAIIVATPPLLVAWRTLTENRVQHGEVAELVKNLSEKVDHQNDAIYKLHDRILTVTERLDVHIVDTMKSTNT
jgi:hypothetical protein